MPESYKEFIREAYIDPIRSVLIVDDDYPTIDGMLNSRDSAGARWQADRQSVEKVIKSFRSRQWLIDIHDGSDRDGIATHLHQSDLLVLDYQLDGHQGDGEKCISVINHLALNNHFNLVVVYTQHERPAEVFLRIVLSLLSPCPYVAQKPALFFDQTTRMIEEWQDEEPNIVDRLAESISLELYVSIRHKGLDICFDEIRNGGGRFHQFVSIFDEKPEEVRLSLVPLFLWVIREKERRINTQFSVVDIPHCDWSEESEGSPWIRTDKLFLTVTSKAREKNLPKALLNALVKWQPFPSRLILSKIRSQIEDLGVSAEDAALQNNNPLQAGWYKNLLKTEDSVDLEIDATITRHWDGLLSGLSDDVKKFVRKLLAFESSRKHSANAIVNKRFGYKISTRINGDEALLQQNAYNCSKSPSGVHLTTGHVLKMANGDHWVCVSPVCDLVPGQKKGKARYDKLEPTLPFHAILLHKYDAQKALAEATKNRCVFLRKEDGSIDTFCCVNPEGEDANPTWEEFFVENQGKFDPEPPPKITIHRSKWSPTDCRVQSTPTETQVVGQLRYEYALNLLQRHGAALSRVGLGFVGLP